MGLQSKLGLVFQNHFLKVMALEAEVKAEANEDEDGDEYIDLNQREQGQGNLEQKGKKMSNYSVSYSNHNPFLHTILQYKCKPLLGVRTKEGIEESETAQ